ncbi:MAG: hypothetical protein IKQ46_09670 [Bacteroidales bacterium]|jgi:hypothetical protein|nr:hypothetical protein [Bacteroidales bacterium]
MQNTSSLFLRIFKWALMLVCVVFFLYFFIDVVPMDSRQDQIESGTTSGFLIWTYLLAGTCAVLSIGFPIYQFIIDTIQNPKSAIKIGLVLAVLGIVALIAYVKSDGGFDSIMPTMVETTEGELFWSDFGIRYLWSMLILAVVAVIAHYLLKIIR